MRKTLTLEEIENAKKLKEEGKSKREISFILKIPQTTIWDNVFNNKPRIREYKPYNKPIETRIPCERCEIMTVDYINSAFIPHNYRVAGMCIKCYLEIKGIPYLDLIVK
jgi:hypothetical protein